MSVACWAFVWLEVQLRCYVYIKKISGGKTRVTKLLHICLTLALIEKAPNEEICIKLQVINIQYGLGRGSLEPG